MGLAHPVAVPRASLWLLLLAGGCTGRLVESETGDDTGSNDDTADTADTSDTSDTGIDTDLSCTGDREGFTAAGGEVVTYFSPLDGLLYEGLSGDVDPIEVLRIELYYGDSVQAGPQQLALMGENYSSCSLCMLVMSGCTQGAGCETSYLAQSGLLVVTENGGTTGNFAAELQGVRFAEVTIASGSYVSTLVPGGGTWCLDDLQISGSIGTAR